VAAFCGRDSHSARHPPVRTAVQSDVPESDATGQYAPEVGFSLFGLITAIAVLAPNFLLLAFPPLSERMIPRTPALLIGVERAGQALCLVVPVITAAGTLSWWWLLAVAVAVTGYHLLWVRYLLRGRMMVDLYRPLWNVPVPMAVLPVLVFLFCAAWLNNPWVAGAAVVLAAGHIPSSLLIARHLNAASLD